MRAPPVAAILGDASWEYEKSDSSKHFESKFDELKATKFTSLAELRRSDVGGRLLPNLPIRTPAQPKAIKDEMTMNLLIHEDWGEVFERSRQVICLERSVAALERCFLHQVQRVSYTEAA